MVYIEMFISDNIQQNNDVTPLEQSTTLKASTIGESVMTLIVLIKANNIFCLILTIDIHFG